MHEVASAAGSWNGKGAIRQIRTMGDPVLREPCRDVTDFGPGLDRLLDDMFASMYAVNGIGLAANQIGLALRVFVFDCPDGFGNWHRGYAVNPRRTFVSDTAPDDSEGCLSIPGVYAEFPRSSHVIVHGVDSVGRSIEIQGRGYFARCLLHETQHLDGTLFVDLLEGRTRKEAMRAIRNLKLDA